MNVVMSHTGAEAEKVRLALFPGLPTVQFIACSMQEQRGRAGPFYHMNDVSVYLGQQRVGEECSSRKISKFEVLRLLLVASETLLSIAAVDRKIGKFLPLKYFHRCHGVMKLKRAKQNIRTTLQNRQPTKYF